MKTTLNKIREYSPCAEGWEKLLRSLNKIKSDDEPLSIVQILDSNGINDAIWCLRAVDGHDKEIRLFAVWCARQVQHLITDPRSIAALDVAERYAKGEATEKELDAAYSAADAAADAAYSAADAAADAAYSAADAASDAAYSAAYLATRAAAKAAAYAGAKGAQADELRRICESTQ